MDDAPPPSLSSEEVAELREIIRAQKTAKVAWAILRQIGAWIGGTAIVVAAVVSAWRGITAK